jgi:hypothetical protein
MRHQSKCNGGKQNKKGVITMSEITKNAESFVSYEYKEVATTGAMEGVYADGYPNFGWKLDGTVPSALGISTVNLKFKRDRKIRNKAELSRLQRQFEQGVGEIMNLERSKTTGAFAAALTIGLIGTAFLAGATIAFIYAEMVLLMVILAVPGFLGWGLSYLFYRRVSAKKSATVAPLIDQQYDTIYELCAKGHALLSE